MRYILRIVIAWGLGVSTVSGAKVTPPGVIPQYTLVRVQLEAGERAWIISEKFLPVDVHTCNGEMVWTGPPGKYAILSWTDAAQAQTFVTIGQENPGPNPGPDPPPPPPPPPPPVTIPNEFGIGKIAYDEARKIGKPTEAATLANAASLALDKLAEGRVTPAMAEAYLKKTREGLTGNWAAWEAAVEQALAQAIVKHGGGALMYRNYFLEIREALKAAANG